MGPQTDTESWEAKAKSKRDAVNDLIPKEWRFTSPIPSAEEQRDVTGEYIWQFLTKREVEITETDAVDIVKQTTTGQWKAEEVIKAFCHRAALAHQIVYFGSFAESLEGCLQRALIRTIDQLSARDPLRRCHNRREKA